MREDQSSSSQETKNLSKVVKLEIVDKSIASKKDGIGGMMMRVHGERKSYEIMKMDYDRGAQDVGIDNRQHIDQGVDNVLRYVDHRLSLFDYDISFYDEFIVADMVMVVIMVRIDTINMIEM
ncbi:uncharacterized protein A4U43_C05F16950 [Asparagus officinalis]|uniref:Uncharacterized protein n=1 Tax=Asparagus officinalis TaxID=4686 RepID=A0A5P1ES55_ASPOF|nr:uncharacterized protein A4U43_C05F16950 [Asparagus officinalis]